MSTNPISLAIASPIKLRRFTVPQMLGAVLMALGVWIIAGWIFHSAMMVQLMPTLVAMVFSTAICFLTSGVALYLIGIDHPSARRAVPILGVSMWLIASLILLENVLDINLLLDLPSLHSWLHDSNPHPGRMAPNTALGFALASWTFILTNRIQQVRWTRFTVVASFMVLMLGITGLIGYTLNLDTLYSWFNGSQMAIHTAIGMIILGLGLWNAWLHLSSNTSVLLPDQRINLIGVLTLLVVSLSTGLAGFVVLQASTKDQLAHELVQTLNGRIDLVRSAFEEGEDDTEILAGEISRSPSFVALTTKPHNANSIVELKSLLQTRANSEELESVAVTGSAGEELASVGRPLALNAFKAPLAKFRSELVWDDGYWLRTTVPITNSNAKTQGNLTVVRSLQRVQAMILNNTGYGKTGESGICKLDSSVVRCFPQYRQPKVYETLFNPDGDRPNPMSAALVGKSGVVVGKDYRQHQVIAAYSPIGDTGLGMVLKQDSWEVFEPIGKQLKLVIPIILLLTAAGMALLRSQIKPLTNRLVRSEVETREAHHALKAEERRIRAVVDNIGEGIITIDTNGIVRSVNPSTCRIFGYPSEALVGKELSILIPEEIRDGHNICIRRYLKDDAAHSHRLNNGSIELIGLRKNGEKFPLELSIADVTIDDEEMFVGIVRDISERTEAQRALHDEKELLHVTLHSIGDAVISTDLQGRVLYLNPIAQEMTGWPKDEAVGQPLSAVFNIINEATGEPAPSPIDTVLLSCYSTQVAEHTVLIQRSGGRMAIEDSAAPIRGQDGFVKGVVIVFHDVTNARRLAEQISYQATHDALTDLVNRREFERRLTVAVQKADSSKGLSLLYLDLDQFKLINDTCGHVAGDQLLIQLSGLIRSKLRSEDTLGRLGGDEFAILLENCPPDVALRVAEAIRQTVRDLQFVWQEKNFTIGVSIGLVSRDGEQTVSDLLKAADSACYVAKDKGRNLVHIYREADVEVLRRNGEMGWVARIEHALREDRFQLFVQPIAALSWVKGVEHVHYEVLVRLLDEEGRLVPPMAFIPAAERYGLMPRIDRWIVEHALGLLESRAPNSPHFTLSINLSATSINEDSFLPFLRNQLTTRNVRTSDICFEITETAAIASLTQSSRMMHELKALGCSFSLDDFGSGMSSFAYLKHLPVDYVKIDGSFVKDIEGDLIDRAMVSAINDIAHVMGIRTIAEFVESSEILKRLGVIGVDFVQGYAIGRPMPSSELVHRNETIEI